jgi:hypothetical protein
MLGTDREIQEAKDTGIRADYLQIKAIAPPTQERIGQKASPWRVATRGGRTGNQAEKSGILTSTSTAQHPGDSSIKILFQPAFLHTAETVPSDL